MSNQLVIWVFLPYLKKKISCLEGPKTVSEECAWKFSLFGVPLQGHGCVFYRGSFISFVLISLWCWVQSCDGTGLSHCQELRAGNGIYPMPSLNRIGLGVTSFKPRHLYEKLGLLFRCRSKKKLQMILGRGNCHPQGGGSAAERELNCRQDVVEGCPNYSSNCQLDRA